jgi:small-conductance mechanosensitive channel/predicted  nucleic acid-binding Zn-ribbon protein
VTPNGAVPVIDQTTLATAQRLARGATTAEELPLAQSAVQTADHELDLAFSGALRAIEAHPPVLSPAALAIQARLDEAQKRLTADADTLSTLAQKMGQAAEADKADLQDQLDLIGSQVELDKDQIEDANNDLLAAGGNVHQRIQKAQEDHAAAERNLAAPETAAPATAFVANLRGMVSQIRQWLTLRSKRRALQQARSEVSASVEKLTTQRAQLVDDFQNTQKRLADLSATRPAGVATAPRAAPATSATAATPANGDLAADTPLALTRRLAVDQSRLMLRDQRISARNKLAGIYGSWDGVVATQERQVTRAILSGAGIVLAALMLLLFADRWLNRLLGGAHIDRRQLATLRGVIGVALQVVAVLLILFVLIGLPGQFATMLGIAGAGLTVALKDFIVAFIGWFVLMGRNGIRIGDWVEINGVSGEVVELGMFHTVLLETGNWTDAGHPTGRHVTFTNSFAIEGHYFNFSTTGQWLWDELTLVVPFGHDPHAIADAIQKQVVEETKDSTRQAEQEWQRASHGQRGTALSAQPGIAVRPASGGVEIAVRYVTRASERYALRARLYQSAVRLLAESGSK